MFGPPNTAKQGKTQNDKSTLFYPPQLYLSIFLKRSFQEHSWKGLQHHRDVTWNNGKPSDIPKQGRFKRAGRRNTKVCKIVQMSKSANASAQKSASACKLQATRCETTRFGSFQTPEFGNWPSFQATFAICKLRFETLNFGERWGFFFREGLREDLRKPPRGTLAKGTSEVFGGSLRDPLGGRFSTRRLLVLLLLIVLPLNFLQTYLHHPKEGPLAWGHTLMAMGSCCA